jgi:hypothetical protein
MFAGPALADSVAGLCPDGSMFIVAREADAPCARAKFVDDPSHMPPIKPHFLPRPYTWYVDQESRDPNNPYNLLDAAEQIRAARNAQADRSAAVEAEAEAQEPVLTGAIEPSAATQPAPIGLALAEDETRDLVRLVVLRQEVAPATFTIEDVHRQEQLVIRLAHSATFEQRVRDALGAPDRHILLFSARAVTETEFQPNFFLVRDGATFRPDPENSREVGYIVGDAGPLEEGYIVLGYLSVPARFDPASDLEVWWNDHSLRTVLRPN